MGNDEIIRTLLRPDRVLIKSGVNIQHFFEVYQGLPLKIVEEKLIFVLNAKYPILTSNTTDKAWRLELRQWYSYFNPFFLSSFNFVNLTNLYF